MRTLLLTLFLLAALNVGAQESRQVCGTYKYYVQAKILNDKNAELSKEVSERQRLKVEMEKINNISKELEQKINNQKKINEEISQENNNLKKQLLSISKKYNDTKLKSSSLVSKLK